MELPKWNKNKPYIPVDKHGNRMQYANRYGDDSHSSYYGRAVTLDFNLPFAATLKVIRINVGRSAKYLTVENVETGVQYPMWLDDFLEFIKNGNVTNGTFTGTWNVHKKGANYGIYDVNVTE